MEVTRALTKRQRTDDVDAMALSNTVADEIPPAIAPVSTPAAKITTVSANTTPLITPSEPAAIVPFTPLATTTLGPTNSNPTTTSGTAYSAGSAIVAESMNNIILVPRDDSSSSRNETNRRGMFKSLADFVQTRSKRSEKAAAARSQKRQAIFNKARALGGRKEAGQEGYVKQQIFSVEQNTQIEEGKKQVENFLGGL